jgi:hypothetical protein
MDSPVSDTIANVAGRGVGVLAALTSLKQGGLQNFLLQREAALANPAIRANLVGSPFAAGMLQVSGGGAPAPSDATAAPVAPPADFVGPPVPAAIAAPRDVAYLPADPSRAFRPSLPPLDYKAQLEAEQQRSTMIGLTSSDPTIRTQAKRACR